MCTLAAVACMLSATEQRRAAVRRLKEGQFSCLRRETQIFLWHPVATSSAAATQPQIGSRWRAAAASDATVRLMHEGEQLASLRSAVCRPSSDGERRAVLCELGEPAAIDAKVQTRNEQV